MKKQISIFFILCLFAVFAFAQNGDTVLTFREAIDVALKNNVLLNTQRNNLLASKVTRTSRFAQLGPQISVNGNVYQSNGNRFIQQELKVVNTTVYGAQAQLSVNQPIFNGLAGVNFARSGDELFDAQLEQVNRSTQDVINTVAVQFLQVLLDRELLKIARENLDVQKTQFEQVKAQVELGARSPVDHYNQQAQVSNAELRVVQAEYALANSKITLFQALLVDPVILRSIQEPEWDVNAMALENLTVDQLMDVAMKNRSDLKQARYTEQSAKHLMSANKGNYLPSLNAFYNNGSAYNQVKGAPRDSTFRNFKDQFTNYNRSNSFGLSFSIPIFSGFQTRSQYVQSKVTYENSRLLTDTRELIVKGDVIRAYENYESIKKAFSAGVTGLEASQVAYNLEQERFNLGITSFVDFANANRTFIQAQTDMAQAKYRFIFQKIMLDYAVGTLKPEDIP